jgi:hypothetical protein
MHGNAKKHGWLHTSSNSGHHFLINLYQGGIFQNNHQLLILNGHGSHVTIEALEQTTKIGFNMVTLPSCTSHVLQPLNITCFKPFKNALKKEQNSTMTNKNILNQIKS